MNGKGNDWLDFNRRERSGILFLLLLSAGAWMAPFLYERLFPPAPVTWTLQEPAAKVGATDSLFEFDPNRASETILRRLGLPPRTAATIVRYRRKGGRFDLPEDLRKIYNLSAADYERIAPYIRIAPSLRDQPLTAPATAPASFLFDPNTVSFDSLRRLGVPARVARTLINYREAGGIFRRPADLKKVYGMTADHLERLLPQVALPAVPDSTGDAAPASDSLLPETASVPPLVVDVNRADAATWAQLRGIGPVLSERIVRFRERLGGFTSIDQVAETYGLPDSTFEVIRPQLRSSPPLRRLAINELDWQTLRKHPYLNRREARALVAYRQAHGPFSGPEALSQVRALNRQTLTRILPYLTFGRSGPEARSTQ